MEYPALSTVRRDVAPCAGSYVRADTMRANDCMLRCTANVGCGRSASASLTAAQRPYGLHASIPSALHTCVDKNLCFSCKAPS